MTDDHQSVMTEEVLAFLAPRPDGVYLDGTLGAGGHAEAIIRSVGGRCTLIGVDQDPKALARAGYNLQQHAASVRLVRTNFEDLDWIVASQEVEALDGVLLDLGMSSMQLDEASRGFAFRSDGPLDMRMDPDAARSAADIVNTASHGELARILRTYGEERHAARLARAIVAARRRSPVRTTSQLADIVAEAYPQRQRRQHPARRTFQALRIATNRELDVLEKALRALPDVLAVGGRAVVISYHSLEDRMVKRIFSELSGAKASLPGLGTTGERGPLRVLTSGAVLPSDAEVERNPRASAARLRAAIRRAGA